MGQNKKTNPCINYLFIFLCGCKLKTGADSSVCNSRTWYWLSEYTFLNSVACILEYTLAWTHSITVTPAINNPHQQLIRNPQTGNWKFYPSGSKVTINTQETLNASHVGRKTQNMHQVSSCLYMYPMHAWRPGGYNIYSSMYCKSHGNSTEQPERFIKRAVIESYFILRLKALTKKRT